MGKRSRKLSWYKLCSLFIRIMHDSGLCIRNFVLFYLKNAQSSQMKLGNILFLKQSERRSASWVVPMSQEWEHPCMCKHRVHCNLHSVLPTFHCQCPLHSTQMHTETWVWWENLVLPPFQACGFQHHQCTKWFCHESNRLCTREIPVMSQNPDHE